MESRYQQVTDPEEAWKYYEAGLLLRRVRTFNYGPKEREVYTYYKEHEIAGYGEKEWSDSEVGRGVYFILVEDE